MIQKTKIAHLPTPLERNPALDALLGVHTVVKRDDLTGGDGGGNKLRKLEYLMADAQARGATVVLTCGAMQSNHARATASSAAKLGKKAILFLWTRGEATGPEKTAPRAVLAHDGNQLIDRLLGAEIRVISLADYKNRQALMEAQAERLRKAGETPYVIPEGGSNGLGSLGYVDAMGELQADVAEHGLFEEVVVACGSGGTAAGASLGIARHPVAKRIRAVCVCDDALYFKGVAERIVLEARALDPSLPAPGPVIWDEEARGPRYGTMSTEQLAFLKRAASEAGLLTDPVYTGKALFGLWLAAKRGDYPRGARVLFLHSGGLPGLLGAGPELTAHL